MQNGHVQSHKQALQSSHISVLPIIQIHPLFSKPIMILKQSVLILLLLSTLSIEAADTPYLDDHQDDDAKFKTIYSEQVASSWISPSYYTVRSLQPSGYNNKTSNDTRASDDTTPTGGSEEKTTKNPNIIFIITDEHNFRTLGCYRDYLLSKHTRQEVNVWGKKNVLYTPNLDRLAKEGALFANFYSVAPKCTPSRASFLSGLYPQYTEANNNHAPMDTRIQTWAEILQEKKGYYTSYIGKWHLDGDEKPGWDLSESRKFGFNETKYRFNRGHWKYFEENGNEVKAYTINEEYQFHSKTQDHYATDFLFNKGMDFITKATTQNTNDEQPFAVMMSIPDPHQPNQNQPKYRQTYDNITFNMPRTAFMSVQSDPASPEWNNWIWDLEGVSYKGAKNYLRNVRNSESFQTHLRQYYGMVKCIDDNVGKLLSHLKTSGIDNNTMIVFTSDHGDMLYEHGELDKGTPYQASAGVPFLVHYPGVVPPNKIIETAYSSIDTFPTLLSLAGIDLNDISAPYQGVDASPELLSSADTERNESKIILMHDVTSQGDVHRWVAVSTNRHKLVVSQGSDRPYLFDLERDPYEIYNYIDSLNHEFIKQKLQLALVDGMKKHDMTVGRGEAILFDSPTCIDTRDTFKINGGKTKIRCTDSPTKYCAKSSRFSKKCPVTCKTCSCENSPGLILVNGELTTCGKHLRSQCSEDKNIALFCPKLCNSVKVGSTKVCRF